MPPKKPSIKPPLPSLSSLSSLRPVAALGHESQTMPAPTGRNKIAQGNALGNLPQDILNAEGARENSLGRLVQPRREKAIPAEHPDLPYIGLEHIEAQTTKLLGCLPATEMKSTANRFCTGDVLYSRLRPYLNKVWRADRDGLCSSEFIVLPGNDSVDSGFLRYRLNAADFVSFANSLNAGDRPRVDFDQIASFCLPPFSLAEQRRIVAEIEKQFTRLEAGVAALRRVQANLKRYRAAVLKAACEGKLVPTEAELVGRVPSRGVGRAKGNAASGDAAYNDAPFESGPELLTRILAERKAAWETEQRAKAAAKAKDGLLPSSFKLPPYKPPAAPDTANLPPLPEGWMWAGMKQVGEVQLGRQRAPQHHIGDHMRPYLRVANVFEALIDTADVKEMNFTPEEFEKYRLRFGDILLNEGQTPELVGRPAMYREEIPDCCYQKTLLRFRAHQGVLPQFALTVFRSYMHSGRFKRSASITTNIAHLTAEKFVEIEFPLPPLAEQTRIVAEVERRLSVVEELESVVSANLQRAVRLRQAILQKAFCGRL